jgi:thioesterase domain-containing protein
VVATSEQAADPRRLAELLDVANATVLQATPTTWRMLIESGWTGRAGLKALCGGEALPQALADGLAELGLELWNVYGPTETTIWSTASRVKRAGQPITIGRPIANTSVYVLDSELRPMPVGVPGELYIGGSGLARGYRNRPELTAERFVSNPFGPSGSRLYRTGDLVRRRRDGEIEYLGRLDHQVKLRGFRIELGEVETALARHPAVAAAVAVVREDGNAGPRLVGYVVSPDGASASSSELRRHVGESLPAYMVPGVVLTLDSFPLTPNGKIDRKALPEPSNELTTDSPSYVPARTPIEAALVEIWEDVLGIAPVGVTDDFFELGQTSIVAARLFARIEHDLGARLPISPLFEAPTIEQLAVLLAADELAGGSRFSSLVPIQSAGDLPPIYCVHGGAGTILHLGRLARELGPEQPFYGLQARGLYGRETPLTRVEDMAAHYLSEIRAAGKHGPYRIAGYCFGAIVAFEMAQQLRADGEEVELLAMFNGPSPSFIHAHGQANRPPIRPARGPQVPRLSRVARARRSLREPHRIVAFGLWRGRRRLRRAYWTLVQVRFRLAAALGRPLPESVRDYGFLNINMRAEVAYEPVAYPGEIILFRGDGLFYDEETGWGDPHLGWGELADNVEVHVVPGRHRDNRELMGEPAVVAVAETLGRKLSRLAGRRA